MSDFIFFVVFAYTLLRRCKGERAEIMTLFVLCMRRLPHHLRTVLSFSSFTCNGVPAFDILHTGCFWGAHALKNTTMRNNRRKDSLDFSRVIQNSDKTVHT